MDNNAFYKHSGNAPISGILLTIIVGLIGAVVFGTLYGFIIAKSPFIYLNVIATVVFGVFLGLVIGYGAKLGKIRNFKLIFILSLVVSVVAVYVHWVVWLKVITEVVILDPLALKAALSYISTIGAWSIFDSTPTGWLLWTFWIVEALIVVIATSVIANDSTDIPFCEDVNEWAIETNFEHAFYPIQSAENIKFPHELLNQLRPLDQESNQYGTLSVSSVDDSSLRCVSFNHVSIQMDKDEEKITKDVVIKYMLFDLGNYAKLLEIVK